MGKVIKGSAESAERYTLTVPAFAVPAALRANEDDAAEDYAAFAALSPEFEPPPEPAVDLAAIQAQADEILADARHTARSLVDDAQERARGAVLDAEKRAQALADEARRSGRDEGYAQGANEAHAEMTGMILTMRELVDGVRNERHALLTSAEPELVRLAVGIAERVLHQQVALDHGVVVEMARAAISRIVDREKITVRVNPADIERMREHRDELLALGDVKTMRVIEDQRVERGGVIVETDAGSIDAKISTQLSEVRKILHIVDDVIVQAGAAAGDGDGEAPPTAARAS